VALPQKLTIGDKKYELDIVILHKSKALNHGHYIVYFHRKKIIIDDEKVYYNKVLKLDYSYFYIAFYV
jgi:Ubiquitin carboxyl-terminal hydrolase.